MGFKSFNLVDIKSKIDEIKFDGMDWRDIKRLPQTFKRTTKLVDYTIDEQFDNLHKHLGIAEARLHVIIKSSMASSQTVETITDTALQISQSMKELANPYIDFDLKTRSEMQNTSFFELDRAIIDPENAENFNKVFGFWEYVKEYEVNVEDQKSAIGDPNYVSKIIVQKCQMLLEIIDCIKSKVKDRNRFLDNYDAIHSQLISLKGKQATYQLLVKESQQIFNVERKLDYRKQEYESINRLLINELPIFFEYYNEALSPILYLFYFNQLSVGYQFLLPLLDLRNPNFNEDLQSNEAIKTAESLIETFRQIPGSQLNDLSK